MWWSCYHVQLAESRLGAQQLTGPDEDDDQVQACLWDDLPCPTAILGKASTSTSTSTSKRLYVYTSLGKSSNPKLSVQAMWQVERQMGLPQDSCTHAASQALASVNTCSAPSGDQDKLYLKFPLGSQSLKSSLLPALVL